MDNAHTEVTNKSLLLDVKLRLDPLEDVKMMFTQWCIPSYVLVKNMINCWNQNWSFENNFILQLNYLTYINWSLMFKQKNSFRLLNIWICIWDEMKM